MNTVFKFRFTIPAGDDIRLTLKYVKCFILWGSFKVGTGGGGGGGEVRFRLL